MPKSIAKRPNNQKPTIRLVRALRPEMARTLHVVVTFARMNDGLTPTPTELVENFRPKISKQVAAARLRRLRHWGYIVKDKEGKWKVTPNLCDTPNSARFLMIIHKSCPKRLQSACEISELKSLAKKNKVQNPDKLIKIASRVGYLISKKLNGKVFIAVGPILRLETSYLKLVEKKFN